MARPRVVFLAVGMLLFGTINTLTTKFQDLAVVGHTPDGKPLTFKHPAVQSAFMFFGEMLCLVPYFLMEWRYSSSKNRVRRRAELARLGPTFRVRRVLIFAIPAACDTVATTLLNVGLFYTFASTYQMLRGTLVLFAGFFTVAILRRQLYVHHWLGMVLIMGGAALVGAASVLSAAQHHGGGAGEGGGGGGADESGGGGVPELALMGAGAAVGGRRLLLGFRRLASTMLGADPGVDAASAPLFGDLCVVAAQAFTALQFILEEKFVSEYRVPTLLAVGLEGLWGMAVCGLALPVLALVRAGPDGRPVDSAAEALREIGSNGALAASVAVSIVSIGIFNFFGISVTRALSGAGRAAIDATRTIFIWLASMWLGWEQFLPLQVVGFAVLFAGTSLYNELIRICLPRPDEDELLLEEEGSRSGYESSGSDEEGTEARGGGKGADPESGSLAEPLLGPGSKGSPSPPAGGTSLAAAAAAPASSVPISPRGMGAGGAAAAGFGWGGGVPAGEAAGAQGAAEGAGAGGGGAGARPAGRRGAGRDSSDSEYTMARSMRLGQSTLMPHALDADADTETESEGVAGNSPGMSFGSGHTGGFLSQPNIPEGDEENELVGAMSGVDLGSHSQRGAGGRGRGPGGGGEGGGARVTMALGPHGMLSGGVGRGGGLRDRR